MNGKLNKILPIAGLFCGSLVFSSVFADTDTTSDSQPMKSQMQEITPPAGFAAEQGIGFSVYGDFIYWEARQANLGFAQTDDKPTETYYPSFKYKPGFKAGIAFDLGHDNWDLDANYTWLNGSAAKNSIVLPIGSTLKIENLYNVAASSNGDILESDTSWFLHQNLINVDLGRNYYISQFLTLRPYFGLSGAWNNQKQIVHYTYADDSGQTRTYDQLTSLYFKQNYWGVGFNTGLQTNWCFDENWAIYGNFGLMNLWSKYRVQSKETDYTFTNNVISTDGEISANTQSTQYGLQNVIDLEAGIRWGMTIDDDTKGVSIQAGWEQQVWINHAQYANTDSNLSLQGLTARLRLDF